MAFGVLMLTYFWRRYRATEDAWYLFRLAPIGLCAALLGLLIGAMIVLRAEAS